MLSCSTPHLFGISLQHTFCVYVFLCVRIIGDTQSSGLCVDVFVCVFGSSVLRKD